jgi:type I site-specific restriction-modification system R (restriction) subunit
VNGIPLVVIEAKIGDATTANPLHAAFEQLLRYRNGRPETLAAGLREGEPRLYHTNLLLIRTCGEKAEFGTITSGHEHFYAWKYPLTPALSHQGEREKYTLPLGVEREQERLIQGLLAPATLLDVLRTSTVFMDTDSGKRVKVVCRYQQYRAARRIAERLRSGKSAEERSGVVWHTQGSGKSLTMVFVARMMRASTDLSDFKILLVNDRVDLEEQLAATAKLIGGKVNVIESTADLRQHLATDATDINMVMVHKFMERAEALPLVIASDSTNELAAITEARREAKRWNAVENFCKPFDFDDPDKELSGIAFLIVCDMLLTGFDAPVEQVMYIDKRLREHNLLQAIARVNRVTGNKHRGFIVGRQGHPEIFRAQGVVAGEGSGAGCVSGAIG